MPIASRKILLREMIDIAIEQTDEFDAFIAFLRDQGIIVNVGKNITVQTEEMPFAMRTGLLGENYSIRAIRRRLEEKYNSFKEVKVGVYYEEGYVSFSYGCRNFNGICFLWKERR